MSRQRKGVEITPATATTPAMSFEGETDKERMNLSPAEFGAELRLLKEDIKHLVSMALKVGALKTGEHLDLADKTVFGRKQLNALVSRYTKTLGQLKKNYTTRGRKKKRVRTGRKVEGFAKGSILTPELVSFLQNANFGPQTASLRAAMSGLLQSRVLSRAILTPLLTLYEFSNGLRFQGADGKVYFRAGPEMERYLNPYLTKLEQDDAALSDADRTDKNGKVKPRFDRNQFIYSRLQSIVNQGILPSESLPQEYKDYLEQPAVKDQLRQVQELVSAAKAAYQ